MSHPDISLNQAIQTGKHPRGLYVLFFTEMWERFGYYLMVGIFFLYLTDTISHGGRGLDVAPAISIVGSLCSSYLFNSFHRRTDRRQVSRLYEIHFFRWLFTGTRLFFNCTEWKRYSYVPGFIFRNCRQWFF